VPRGQPAWRPGGVQPVRGTRPTRTGRQGRRAAWMRPGGRAPRQTAGPGAGSSAEAGWSGP